jgi:hypothetical protein
MVVRTYVNAKPRPEPERSCPDGGFCHHGCPADPNTEPCFRTLWCAPFSDYNGGDGWKDDDR